MFISGMETISGKEKILEVSSWWLADVADGEPNAMYVDIYGEIHEEGKSFYKTNMGVRPAMWLKLD